MSNNNPPAAPAPCPEPGYWDWIPEPFAALKHRNYRLYWLGQIISLIGTWMQRTAMGWLVTDLVLEMPALPAVNVEAATSWWVAVISAWNTLPVLFLSPFAGVFADYLDKRRVIIFTQSLLAAQALALAILAYAGAVNITYLILLAAFFGIVTALDTPARQGMAIELVGRRHLTSAIALNSGVFNSARVIGPGITGIMLALKFKVADAFMLNALSFIAVIAALVLMRGDFSARAKGGLSRMSYWRRTAEGMKYLIGARGIRRIVVMIGVLALLVAPFIALLPAIARYQLSAGVAQFGFLAASFGAGAVIGAFALSLLSTKKLQHLTLQAGYVMLIGGVIVLSQLNTLWLAYIALGVAGLGFNWTFANSNTMIQLEVPDEMRGRAMGVYSMFHIGLYPVGTLMMGLFAKNFGISSALLYGAIISAAVCAVLFIGRPLYHPERKPQQRYD